jgi:hypothetical protein
VTDDWSSEHGLSIAGNSTSASPPQQVLSSTIGITFEAILKMTSSSTLQEPGTTLTMEELYDSAPLSFGINTNFRVLEIERHLSKDSLIACKLQVVSMEKSPIYTALSYTWGDPTQTRAILLNGRPITVRQNLWDFLSELRDRLGRRPTTNDSLRAQIHSQLAQTYSAITRTRPELLWIDALCINQHNLNERSHEVSMMGTVYSRVNEVVVWLGQSTPQIETAMRTLGNPEYRSMPEDSSSKEVSQKRQKVVMGSSGYRKKQVHTMVPFMPDDHALYPGLAVR